VSKWPQGWAETSFGEINAFAGRSIDPSDTPAQRFELYSVPSFPSGRPELVVGAEIGSTKQTVEPNDILVCKINPRINRVWRVAQRGPDPQIASSEWIALRAPGLSARFLSRYFTSPAFRELICEGVTGVGGSLTRAQPKRVAEFPVPVPPLAEQERIANKLDVVLTRLGACRESLDRVLTLTARLRHSVLVMASNGELTSEWRESRGASDWAYERAGDVCEKVQSGGTPKAGFIATPGVPFLKVYNIVNQRVAFETRSQYITKAVHMGPMAKSQARPGDVLMNIVGPPLGKVAIVPATHQEWNINQAITLFRPSDRVTTDWLYIVLSSGALVDAVAHETKGTAGQVNISLSQCRDFVVPIPSVDEQLEISRRVSNLLSSADRLESQVRMASGLAATVAESAMAKAFRGELVSQDPGDEPASELIMRIRNLSHSRRAAGKSVRAAMGDPLRRTKRETSMLTKKDVTQTHLTNILKVQGALTAEALWAASQLEIDDFYDQLKDEEANGLLRERRDADRAARLLEATR
jgi:type I restriction enzyme, S subunit